MVQNNVRGADEALPEGVYNRCTGIVQEVTYVGTARIYDIAVNGTDVRVTARVGALQAGSAHHFVQGDAVQVLWHVEHGRLLIDDAPESQRDVMDVPGSAES